MTIKSSPNDAVKSIVPQVIVMGNENPESHCQTRRSVPYYRDSRQAAHRGPWEQFHFVRNYLNIKGELV